MLIDSWRNYWRAPARNEQFACKWRFGTLVRVRMFDSCRGHIAWLLRFHAMQGLSCAPAKGQKSVGRAEFAEDEPA